MMSSIELDEDMKDRETLIVLNINKSEESWPIECPMIVVDHSMAGDVLMGVEQTTVETIEGKVSVGTVSDGKYPTMQEVVQPVKHLDQQELAVEIIETPRIPSPAKPAILEPRVNSQRPKLLIFADSHGRGLQELLAASPIKYHTVQCVFKPNAGYVEIVSPIIEHELGRLLSRDKIVIIAGTNDVEESRADIFATIKRVISVKNAIHEHKNETCQIIIVEILDRFDKGCTANLNKIIHSVNGHIQKLIKTTQGVSTLQVCTLNRKTHYSKYGLHLNLNGKCKLAKLLAAKVLKLDQPCKAG